MGKILLFWGYDADLIECPDSIEKNLLKCQRDFDVWISNKNNKHGYWSKDSEGNLALSFTGEAFLNWLNEFVLKDSNEKAKFLKREYIPDSIDLKLPRINF